MSKVKKYISGILSLIMLILCVLTGYTTPVSAAFSIDSSIADNVLQDNTYDKKERSYIVECGDEGKIVFHDYFENNTRTIEFESNGKNYKVSVDYTTGVMKINDKIAAENVPAVLNDSEISLYGWKYSYSEYYTVSGAIGKHSVWIAALLGFFGAAVPAAIITGLASILAFSGVSIAYIKVDIYYEDPIITSRPKISKRYYVYDNPTYSGSPIWSYP